MRPSRLLGAAALLAAGVVVGQRAYARLYASPFRLWDFRAGMRFATLDAQARREAGSPFTCRAFPVAGVGRLCALSTTGIRGLARVLVDTAGRAVVIQFQSVAHTPVMRDEMRKAAATWTRLQAPEQLGPADGVVVPTSRWRSADGRWAAVIAFDDRGADRATLRDDAALARLERADVRTLFALETYELIEPLGVAERAAAESTAFAAARRTAARDAIPGRALALESAKTALCGPAFPDLTATGDGWRSLLGERWAAIVERAIGLAHPGAWIVGDDATYLVDQRRLVERIGVITGSEDSTAHLAVFGVNYVRRADAAERGLRDAIGADGCRAPAELIVATLDDSGDVVAARALPLDAEASLSRVERVDVRPSLSGPPVVVAEVESSYGGDGWWGTVRWLDYVATDSLRYLGREPQGFTKQVPHADEARGQFVARTASPFDPELMAVGTPDDARRTPAPFIPTMLLAVPGPSGLASGWILLARL